MVYRRNLGVLGASFQPTVQSYSLPASVGGVNALDSLMAMPPQDCIYTHNLMPVEYGLRLRKGYREWAINCVEDPPRAPESSVKTVIGYESREQDASQDKLWAVTAEGIWNTTLFNTTAPVQEVVFTETGSASGYGVYCEYTNDSERHFLLYADGLNGLHVYEEGVGWSTPPSGVGDTDWYYKDPVTQNREPFPVSNIAYVMVHKLRIWVILEDSDDAWYLPIFSSGGELTKFSFGSKLTNGGNLMGLYNWTVDGGDGVDDYMIAVSRGGDVALYRGSDPALPDWGTTGTWFVGEVPESRRVVAAHGADLFILSTYGITSLRDLLAGTVAEENRTSLSAKVNRFLQSDVETGKDFREWAINIHPADAFMQVVTPEPANTPYVQYNQSLSTKAWGFWEGVPVKSAQTWNGDYFIGSTDGKILLYDDVLDGTELAKPSIWTGVPEAALPAAWTEAPAGQFNVDGTQTASSAVSFGLSEPIVPELSYDVFFEVTNYVSGSLRVAVGGAITDSISADGLKSFRLYNEQGTADFITFIVTDDFVGSIGDVSFGEATELGKAIEFRTLTSFQAPDSHAQFKRAGLIRTVGVLAGTANINVRAVFDYNIETSVLPPAAEGNLGSDVWNSAVWDKSLWDFSVEGASFPIGVLGMGRAIAVAIRGSASTRINVVGWDVMYNRGGYL